MTSTHSAFRLEVSWDYATLALEHAIERGRQHFTVLERDNGYLRIREQGGVTLDIEIVIESPESTRIFLSNTRRWLGLHTPKEMQVNAVMHALRGDVMIQLRADMNAA